MPIVIQRATKQDRRAIADLNVEAYSEFADSISCDAWAAMESSLRERVGPIAERGTYLVARTNGEVVGSVAYCPPGKSDLDIFPPDWATILLLAVSPRYRGQGIGKQLVRECLNLARRDQAQTVGLHTSELMTAARHLYEASGFQQESELPRRSGLRYWRYRLSLAIP
jgi:ribosomal protein S18 acetylase RimI-like enzyme